VSPGYAHEFYRNGPPGDFATWVTAMRVPAGGPDGPEKAPGN
jgi:hypothetical protein